MQQNYRWKLRPYWECRNFRRKGLSGFTYLLKMKYEIKYEIKNAQENSLPEFHRTIHHYLGAHCVQEVLVLHNYQTYKIDCKKKPWINWNQLRRTWLTSHKTDKKKINKHFQSISFSTFPQIYIFFINKFKFRYVGFFL